MTDVHIDYQVRSNPGQHFESPEVLLRSNKSTDYKIAVLRAWERNLRQLMVASGEGMRPSAEPAGDPGETLQQVHDALQKLGEPYDSEGAQSDISGSQVKQ